MKPSAQFSECGTYRLRLGRRWDDRPVLLVVMFNPSYAGRSINDPTITLVCHIASHNGFGGIVVVNAIPLIASTPGPAVEMTRWDKRRDWYARDWLQRNLAIVEEETARAGAVLLAWGALGERCPAWMDHVREQIEYALPQGSEIYCLGKTAGGHPKHPLARGKHKVPKNAPLIPWSNR